jgi:hypothetical protein
MGRLPRALRLHPRVELVPWLEAHFRRAFTSPHGRGVRAPPDPASGSNDRARHIKRQATERAHTGQTLRQRPGQLEPLGRETNGSEGRSAPAPSSSAGGRPADEPHSRPLTPPRGVAARSRQGSNKAARLDPNPSRVKPVRDQPARRRRRRPRAGRNARRDQLAMFAAKPDWPARDDTREWALAEYGEELWAVVEEAMAKRAPAWLAERSRIGWHMTG